MEIAPTSLCVHLARACSRAHTHSLLASLYVAPGNLPSVYVIGVAWIASFCCFCVFCPYTWLYSICFIFCTIVNPIVPVAWLGFFGYKSLPCAWRSVCVCVASRLFFYTEVINGVFGCYRVCLYSVFLNTVTTPAKHVHFERMEETKIFTVINCSLIFFICF